ncbi:MAG TPA: glucosamine-6-phosphate deaminase [Symbiobacteriaceae bacterium]|nr:glucosamine-6-phosphate deaminase [Symbiobacteriaceae bacterium]
MHIVVYDTYEQMCREAAEWTAALIRRKPDAVLGLPTGGTPEGYYAALVKTGVSFRQVRTFNLDEYLGLPRTHPESYHSYMTRALFSKVDLDPANCRIPDGMAPDPEGECRRYEEAIQQAGGIDLILLGLGPNGHIGFNEPGSPWDARTRRVPLTEETRTANARFFAGRPEAVPREALTVGIGTILQARRILLLAAGAAKAEIARRTLYDQPGPDVPATALRQHDNVTFLLDREAAALL